VLQIRKYFLRIRICGSGIQISGSENNTDKYRTDGGMLQGLPLSILDALQSQPPTHFGYENGENFLDL